MSEELVKALQAQEPADADGVRVIVSRQAVDEAIAALTAQQEPVAWIYIWPDGGKPELHQERLSEEGREGRAKIGVIERPLIYGDTTPPSGIRVAADQDEQYVRVPVNKLHRLVKDHWELVKDERDDHSVGIDGWEETQRINREIHAMLRAAQEGKS